MLQHSAEQSDQSLATFPVLLELVTALLEYFTSGENETRH